MSPYSNAHANVFMSILHFWFPGNHFEFGIILNDFSSSTIWAIQIQASFPGVEIAKNPGIQPTNKPDCNRLSNFFDLYIYVYRTSNK